MIRRAACRVALIIAFVAGCAVTRVSAGSIDLYVVGYSFSEIYTYTASGSGSLFIPQGGGLNSVAALALGPNGNVYVANTGTGDIDEVTPSGSISLFVSTGYFSLDSIAFDGAGDLYAAEAINPDGSPVSTVEKITPGGSVSTFSTGVSGPLGLAVEGNNLFVANFWTNSVDEIALSGPLAGLPSTFASGLSEPSALAFDSAGNLFVANGEADTIDEFAPNGSGSQFADNTVSVPDALTFGPNGNLYVTGGLNDPIDEYTPGGALSVFAVLPDASSNPQPDALVFAPAPVPVPEPASLCLFTAALLMLGATRACRGTRASFRSNRTFD